STTFSGARVGAQAGLDSIQHGMQIDDEIATVMARNNVALVSTLSVFASSMSLATMTNIDHFASEAGRKRTAEQYEGAKAALAAAHPCSTFTTRSTHRQRSGGGLSSRSTLRWPGR